MGLRPLTLGSATSLILVKKPPPALRLSPWHLCALGFQPQLPTKLYFGLTLLAAFMGTMKLIGFIAVGAMPLWVEFALASYVS